jgi:hypothetical protein
MSRRACLETIQAARSVGCGRGIWKVGSCAPASPRIELNERYLQNSCFARFAAHRILGVQKNTETVFMPVAVFCAQRLILQVPHELNIVYASYHTAEKCSVF